MKWLFPMLILVVKSKTTLTLSLKSLDAKHKNRLHHQYQVGEHRLLASQLLALYFTWIKLLKTLISLVLLKQAVFPKWKEEPKKGTSRNYKLSNPQM